MNSQNIIVSGANGHLGTEVVQKLVGLGHTLYVTTGSKYKGEFDNESKIHPVTVDLLDAEASHHFVKQSIAKAKGINSAIFLAGGYTYGSIEDTSDEQLEKMFQLNFFTAFHLVQPLIDHFKSQGGGQLIFIGAKAAIQSEQGASSFAYALSKSLLFKMSDMINAKYESAGIVATVIAPSTIDTAPNREAMPKSDFSKWVTPSDIAENIAFVLSDAGKTLRQPVLKVYNQS